MKFKIFTLSELKSKYNNLEINSNRVGIPLGHNTSVILYRKYLGEWIDLEPATKEMISRNFGNGKMYRYITNNNDSIWSVFFKKKDEELE